MKKKNNNKSSTSVWSALSKMFFRGYLKKKSAIQRIVVSVRRPHLTDTQQIILETTPFVCLFVCLLFSLLEGTERY